MASKNPVDKENMQAVLEEFPKHCEEAVKLAKDIGFTEKFENVVFCGMGGSAISGDLLKDIAGDTPIPFYTIRDYGLPKYIKSKSLVFVTSYSGNTEEILSSLHEAYQRNCRIIAVSSGGKLESECKSKNIKHIRIPSGIQPRLATPYLFFPMLNILKNSKLLKVSDDEIKDTLAYLKKADISETGKDLADKLHRKIPLIYASARFSSVAIKWKTDINENSKVHAFYNICPEFNHNELNAFEGENSDYYVVIITDDYENIRIARRIGVTSKLIKAHRVDFTHVSLKGDSMLKKVLSAVYTGLWLSYHLAMKYGTDPTPVKIIENLKKMLR